MGKILSELILGVISNYISEWLPFPLWIFAIVIIFLWWLMTFGVRQYLIYHRIRKTSVIILAHQIIFFSGAIFIFNLFTAPIVLIAFHGMAFYSLIACMTAAVLYFIRVVEKEESDNEI